jgi:hypothetical protein
MHELGCRCGGEEPRLRPGGLLSRRDVLRMGAVGAGVAALGPSLLRSLANSGARFAWRPAVASIPDIVTRAQWGADESLRSGTPEFAAIKKLIVHHTATQNNDPDPAATVRSIYQFHTQSNGWNDIGYNFLIDETGRIYEGRYARVYSATEPHTGESSSGAGVVGAHALGVNAGSCGVALLGMFTSQPPTPAAIDALVRVLAWKASAHTIDPFGSSPYTKSDGSTLTFPNISGHRDTYSTACPGDVTYDELPSLRARVAAAQGVGLIGYRILGIDGGLRNFGGAYGIGDVPGMGLRTTARGVVSTPSGLGAWIVGADGGVFSFGDAQFFGSTGNMRLTKPVVGMAPTPTGNGYWLVASDGGIFSFGDAGFFGSTGNMRLNKPVVGMAATKSGRGYWLVASDGGIFSFGDAVFRGSTGNIRLNQPVVGMARTASGNGYWLVASDGGVFCFGDAQFHGSVPGLGLQGTQPSVQLLPTPSGGGYIIVNRDGGVFTFGDAPFHGSAVGSVTEAVGIAPVIRG